MEKGEEQHQENQEQVDREKKLWFDCIRTEWDPVKRKIV